MAHLIVTALSMGEQDCKVGNVEIGEWGVESGRQGPRESHEQVTATFIQTLKRKCTLCTLILTNS